MSKDLRARRRVSIKFPEHTMAKQAMKEECDINRIMKRYERDGIIDHANNFNGNYGDFTKLPECYHDACNQVIAAQEMFMTVPASIRAKFGNDPGRFLAFVEDPSNEKEMREIGLLPPARQNDHEEGPSGRSEGSPVSKKPQKGGQIAESSQSPPEGS